MATPKGDALSDPRPAAAPRATAPARSGVTRRFLDERRAAFVARVLAAHGYAVRFDGLGTIRTNAPERVVRAIPDGRCAWREVQAMTTRAGTRCPARPVIPPWRRMGAADGEAPRAPTPGASPRATGPAHGPGHGTAHGTAQGTASEVATGEAADTGTAPTPATPRALQEAAETLRHGRRRAIAAEERRGDAAEGGGDARG